MTFYDYTACICCRSQYLNLAAWMCSVQDGTFNYDAPIWQDGTISTFGTGATYQNTKTEAMKRWQGSSGIKSQQS